MQSHFDIVRYNNTLTEKNSIAKKTIFWSSEPENIAIRPILRYGPQNYTSIGETAIQVR